ncbi:MAG: hypothetical protein K6C94_02050 [Candidatus Gastranaerophilales bacterium]|nr:hypothetical protein [Candidatus Gastranaerophilales bacterium]
MKKFLILSAILFIFGNTINANENTKYDNYNYAVSQKLPSSCFWSYTICTFMCNKRA